MSQFQKYIEKERGGNRLDQVVNFAIGDDRERMEKEREHFLMMEGLKADFRNQNRNASNMECFENPCETYLDDGYYEGFQESDLRESLKEPFNESLKEPLREPLKDESNDVNDMINECGVERAEKSNVCLLVVFIVLFIIVIGLIILMKYTKSDNLIQSIKALGGSRRKSSEDDSEDSSIVDAE